MEPGTCAVETGPADRTLEADAGPAEEDLGTRETEADVKTISRFEAEAEVTSGPAALTCQTGAEAEATSRFEAEAEVTSGPMTFVCQTGAEAKATSRFQAGASPAVCLNNACDVVPAASQLLVAPGEVQDEMTMACGVVPAVSQLLVAPAPWMTVLCNTCREPVPDWYQAILGSGLCHICNTRKEMNALVSCGHCNRLHCIMTCGYWIQSLLGRFQVCSVCAAYYAGFI